MTDHTDHTNCDHDHEEDQVIMVLFDGEEEETACDVLGIFEVEDKDYIAIIPQDSDDDVLLYGFKEDDNEVDLIEIETDEEYEKVAAAFEQEFFDEDEDEEEEN